MIFSEDESSGFEKFSKYAKGSEKIEFIGFESFSGDTIFQFKRNISHIQTLSFVPVLPDSEVYQLESREFTDQFPKEKNLSLMVQTYLNNPFEERIILEPREPRFFYNGIPIRISLWIQSNYYKGKIILVFNNPLYGDIKLDLGSLDFGGWKRFEKNTNISSYKFKQKSHFKERFTFKGLYLEFTKKQVPTQLLLYFHRLGILIEKHPTYPGSEVQDDWRIK